MAEPPREQGRTRPLAAGLTDVGRQRRHNEDMVLLKPDCGLFAVADGMGGHNAGDVASKLAATSLGNFFEATQPAASTAPIDLPEEYAQLDPAARRLAAGIRKANHDVFTISSTYQQHHGMGSTMVAIHVEGGSVHVGHVGDSRCYRIRDGELKQLTRDHSLINDALEMKPDLLPEELARLPKNIITRALGMKDAVKVDIKTEAALVGDIYLLCSDGLSGMVPDKQILEVVNLTDDPQEACELLVAEANDAGGNDNISALIVRIAPERADDGMPELEAHETTDAGLGLDETDDELARTDPDGMPASDGPRLEIVADETPNDALLTGVLPDAMAEALASGAEVELDLRGPWTGKRVRVRKCERCGHEIFVGNLFCVECGTRVESAGA